MNDLSYAGNMVESVLWFVFAVAFGAIAFRATGRRRRLSLTLAAAFLAFGISDLIEARTGAWWRPIWLLFLKASCVAVFAYGYWEYRRIRRAEISSASPATNDEQASTDETTPPNVIGL